MRLFLILVDDCTLTFNGHSIFLKPAPLLRLSHGSNVFLRLEQPHRRIHHLCRSLDHLMDFIQIKAGYDLFQRILADFTSTVIPKARSDLVRWNVVLRVDVGK